MTNNVNVDAMLSEGASKKGGYAKKTIDLKRFLNVQCDNGQKEKKMYIRILPIRNDGGIFETVTCHELDVVPSTNFSPYPSKTFTCPSMEKDADGNGKHCPICEAYEYYSGLQNEAKKKLEEAKQSGQSDLVASLQKEADEFYKTALKFRPKTYYILRCIERGKENEGVKFWRFPFNSKGLGIYDKITTVWNNAYKRKIDKTGKDEESNWRKENIFTIDNKGYDLEITIKMVKNDKGRESRVFTIEQDREACALSDDPNLANQWINDPTKWTDLFSIKSYDYLNAVLKSGGRAPLWDNEKRTYVPNLVGTQTADVTTQTNAQVTPKVEPSISINPTVTAPQTPIADNNADAGNEGGESDLPF